MGKTLRISGLIRIADAVRRELSTPAAPAERVGLHRRVQEHLRQVQDILRKHRSSIRDLPAPSQRAYQFLANLQWDNPAIEARPQPPSAARHTLTSWTGLAALMDRAIERLSTDLSEPELQEVGEIIARNSRQIEHTIRRRGLLPTGLTPLARIQRGWLAFFSLPENLAGYLHARRMASRVLDLAAVGSRPYPPPLAIQFRPMAGIFRLRGGHGRPVLALPTPMMAFDEQGFMALAALIFNRGRHARQAVVGHMTAEGYQGIHAELEALGGIVEETRGAAHDLSESFNRVNAAYFGGAMPRPRLTWNRTFTGRKFGHYDFIRDTLMVSRSLDSPQVPSFAVDFLVFHELLHKFHGLHWVNGRGYAHTTEFYRDERKFARYEESEAILDRLARAAR